MNRTSPPLKGKMGVLGLGRSGVAAVRFLQGSGYRVVAWDQAQRTLDGVELYDGPLPEQPFLDCEAVLLSPGIPRTHASVASLIAGGIPLINDCEWLYRQGRALVQPPEFVAITGTNGKSTVTTLVGEMLAAAGFSTQTGGNLGQAALSLWHDDTRIYVLELSSFQLESMPIFRANSAALLNISPDHMDRYPSLQHYLDAKWAIFANQQPGDVVVLNRDDPGLWPFAPRILEEGVQVVGFSIQKPVVGGVYVENGWLVDHRREEKIPIIKTERIRIKGRHNLANAAAATALALSRGADTATVAHILETFAGLPHRMQWVRTINGVTFYNDSKGTNVGAVVESLASFEQPLVLIAGGRGKKTDFSDLRQAATQRVRAVVLIGEAADDLAKVFHGIAPIVRAGSMIEAVRQSLQQASPGDVVLLSPACASFDMFQNFEDRGQQFSEAVHGL